MTSGECRKEAEWRRDTFLLLLGKANEPNPLRREHTQTTKETAEERKAYGDSYRALIEHLSAGSTDLGQ
jgi:hypothetical protein